MIITLLKIYVLHQMCRLHGCDEVNSRDMTSPLHDMLWAIVLGMVWLSIGGHEKPYGLVPKTWD